RPSGAKVFWHSSAQILGEAVEQNHDCHLCLAPPMEDRFFYEMSIEDRPVMSSNYPTLERNADLAIKQMQKLERLVVPKLFEFFGCNK
ncbi:uncharacterized protein BXZ73DRAFT_34305, partial [Epithele typhae]|uniref:uncharacterized protein n=1 Tax=Epithele typhae TaxID=378194 RepID=UPI00200804E7